MNELIASPVERYTRFEEKRKKILRFLRDETWTHASVITNLLDFKNRQPTHKTLNKMLRDNLITKCEVEFTYGKPIVIWGITTTGLALSWEDEEEIKYRPSFEESKIKPTTMNHKLDIQRLRVKAELLGWKWIDGKLLGMRVENQKVPDAVAITPEGRKIAIEVERTVKTRKRYGDIIVSHLASRKRGEWEEIWYLSPNEKLKTAIYRMFLEVKSAKYKGQSIRFSEDHKKPFIFKTYENFFIRS